jgi:Uma2 family endonuclease
MGMPAPQTEWTAEKVRAFPDDGNRYEVLDGELFVSPAPAYGHQFVVGELFTVLRAYVRTHRLGWVLLAPSDIEFSPQRLVQPDLFVVTDAGKGRPQAWSNDRHLSLVVEVLSASTARADRIRKRRIYQSEGVQEYWIVDADSRLVERWRTGDDRPEISTDILKWQPSADADAAEIDLPALFAAALD